MALSGTEQILTISGTSSNPKITVNDIARYISGHLGNGSSILAGNEVILTVSSSSAYESVLVSDILAYTYMSGGRVLGGTEAISLVSGSSAHISALVSDLANAVAPSLNLNFLSGTLDPRINFSRAGNATQYDSTGAVTYAPNNLQTYSNTFTNSAWTLSGIGTGSAPTLTANYATDPFGGNTATRMQMALGATPASAYSRIYGNSSGQNLLNSVWLKSNTGSAQSIYIVSGSGQRPLITITTSWTQFYAVTANISIEIGLAGSAGTENTGDILIYGATCSAVTYETTPRPQDQVITTSGAYYGPRFDYNPNTLAPMGLLIEEQRTNSCLQSAGMNNSPWAFHGGDLTSSVTANAGTAPDGTNTAFALNNVSQVNPIFGLFQIFNIGAGSVSGSVWLKSGTLSVAQFYLSDNSDTILAGGVVSLTGSWQRFTLTTTATTRIQISTNGVAGSILMWGAQFEAGAFPTSYIPTTSAAATRAADVATLPVGSWFNASAGTLVAEYVYSYAASFPAVIRIDDGTDPNRVALYQNGATALAIADVVGGTLIWNALLNGSVAAGAIGKVGATWSSTGMSATDSGAAPVTTAGLAAASSFNRILLGQAGAGLGALNGWLQNVRYWPRALSNAELQAVTT